MVPGCEIIIRKVNKTRGLQPYYIVVTGADIYQDQRSKMGSRSMEEPLSQAMEDDQEIIGRVDFTEDIITEEAPAADMELNQDSIRSDDTTAAQSPRDNH